jgi:hypothetical protein
MSFDDQVDELKRELQTTKLDPTARADAVSGLKAQLDAQINSRRLEFVTGGPEPYAIIIRHRQAGEDLASVHVNEDGSITFQAIVKDAATADDDDDDDLGYFPSYIDYFDEGDFMKDIAEVLKLGVAEYEIDQDDEAETAS